MPETVVKTRVATLEEVRKPASEGRCFAILDACDAPVIYAKVREIEESQAVCLYRGKLDAEVLAEAPYLVQVTPPLLDWIQKTVWKTPWGIFIVANTDLRSLRKHFRRFLTVMDDAGEALYFRYYDPRALSVYLPSCNDEELRVFLGPVLAYGIGDPKSGGVTYFFRDGGPAAPAPPPQGAVLRMRPEQMQAFETASRERLVNRLLPSLRRNFPAAAAKGAEPLVRAKAHHGIEKAAKYGFESEHDIRRFVYLVFAFGDDFDTHPANRWARPILIDEGADPSEKLSLLYESAPPHPVIDKGARRETSASDDRV